VVEYYGHAVRRLDMGYQTPISITLIFGFIAVSAMSGIAIFLSIG